MWSTLSLPESLMTYSLMSAQWSAMRSRSAIMRMMEAMRRQSPATGLWVTCLLYTSRCV